MKAFLLVLALTGMAFAALAVEPGERLADPALEARARAISADLRCLVCQNQSIDDSNAELAADLRRLVRERLKAGDTDAAVKSFRVARYGDFILLTPPFKPATYALWFGPLAVSVLAAFGVWRFYSRARPATGPAGAGGPKPLDAEERRRLQVLLKEDRAP
jgi:cytochrome c-type biogenesis protein CcmH